MRAVGQKWDLPGINNSPSYSQSAVGRIDNIPEYYMVAKALLLKSVTATSLLNLNLLSPYKIGSDSM